VPVQRVVLGRPIRAAVLAFAGMAVLLIVCAPFVREVDSFLFLGAGLPYCLPLAVCAVGLQLAPSRPVRCWFLSGVFLTLPVAGFLCWLLLGPEPDTFLWVFPWVAGGLFALLCAYLLAGLGLAGWGWLRFIGCARQTGDSCDPTPT
jgi:hypothetical protein